MNLDFRHSISRGKKSNLGQTTETERENAAFLLNLMPPEERERMSERIWNEEGFAVELEHAERGIFDAYVRGGLSSEERAAVDRHLLNSEPQREKLRFAATLERQRTVTVFMFHKSWLAIAALVLCAVGLTVSGMFLRKNSRVPAPIATAQQPPQPEKVPPAIAMTAFLIDPLQRADSLPAMKVPKEGMATLNFSLGSVAQDPVGLRIETQSGTAVIDKHELTAVEIGGMKYVTALMNVKTLTPGIYLATATPTGSGALSYSFRVVASR